MNTSVGRPALAIAAFIIFAANTALDAEYGSASSLLKAVVLRSRSLPHILSPEPYHLYGVGRLLSGLVVPSTVDPSGLVCMMRGSRDPSVEGTT